MKTNLLNTWRRCAAVGTGVLGAVLLASVVVPLSASATPAARADTPTRVAFTSQAASVTSSSQAKLKTSVSDTSDQNSSSDNSGNVVLETTHGTEQHTWSFVTKASDLTVDAAGNGTLNITARLGSYGKVNLKLAHNGSPKTTSCNGDTTNYVVTQPVTATGTYYFDSKSSGKHRWGTVGSKTKKFTFPKASVVYTYGEGIPLCNFSLPCFNAVSFDASNLSIDLFGSKGSGNSGSVSGSRSVKLSSPTGATRSDFASASAKMSFTTSGKNATLKLTGSGATSGTATVAGKNASTNSEQCGNGKTMKATFWSASYKPGKHPFAVSEQVFGSMKITKTVNASLARYKS